MTYAFALFAAILNLADLRQAIDDDFVNGTPFSLTCTVVHASRTVGIDGLRNTTYLLSDSTGNHRVFSVEELPILPSASLVAVTGHTGVERYGWPRAYVETIRAIGKGTVPAPIPVTAPQLNDERLDARLATLSGIVSSIQPDEVDPKFSVITLRSPNGPFLGMVPQSRLARDPQFEIAAEVSLTGIVNNRAQGGKRQFQNATLGILPDGIRILKPKPTDPFAEAPGIRDISHMAPAAVANMNLRQTSGRVIARLSDMSVLLKTDQRRIVRVFFADTDPPACGDVVDIAGFPETDLFSLILTGALFRPHAKDVPTEEKPLDLSADQLIFRDDKGLRYQSEHYGRLVRLRGTVERRLRLNGHDLTLVSGGESFDIDLTSCPSLADRLLADTEIELTGICVFKTDAWTTRMIHPHIHGVLLVPRSPADVKILRAAPWWTIRKLLFVISALLAALAAILVWNRGLQRLAERRGRQLFKAEIAQAKADLRVEDRTRLAADIHDSIAQTLTGVGFQIDAAAKTLGENDPASCANFLAVAKRTLLSCREELRRCIWDLRAHSLEEPDLVTAIRETIRPVVGAAAVTVRFNVPRARLSDTTTHTLLCIVRELAANAVRHGQARQIRIAGEYRDERVRFSVADDGCGFDPGNRAGPSQGHFGLQGIRERLSKLGGKLTIESTPGKGTHIVVEIGK